MKDIKTEQLKGIGAIALCALLWSTSGLLIKLIPWHPMIIAGGRSAIAFFFILIHGRTGFSSRLAIQQNESAGSSFLTSPSSHTAPSSVGNPSPGKQRSFLSSRFFLFLKGPLFLAGLWYALTMILFVIANKLTASANVIVLQYTAPIWAALFGWKIAGEKPRWEHGLAMVLVMIGLVFFFSEGLAGGSPLGDLLALVSGVCFALYSVYMRLQKEGNPEGSLLLSHGITALAGLFFLFWNPPILSWSSLGALFALGIFQIGLASILFAYGIRRVSALQAMLIAMIEPVMNPVWVFLVTGELPGPGAFAGGPIILVAVVGSAILGMYHQKREEPAPPFD
ncbi:MAG: DMT family transporter [Treponemataceae bacterium]|nr:DMT family transporter [Treponemataceae bacterium]HOJ99074.1 DMT family transporter [Termitinemataceae bacterium]HOM22956.1 DMT family transporter [Termitinemataceae bacterium]HPQ00297.1 DMT family transporter [Termitinemataceae bacterium]